MLPMPVFWDAKSYKSTILTLYLLVTLIFPELWGNFQTHILPIITFTVVWPSLKHGSQHFTMHPTVFIPECPQQSTQTIRKTSTRSLNILIIKSTTRHCSCFHGTVFFSRTMKQWCLNTPALSTSSAYNVSKCWSWKIYCPRQTSKMNLKESLEKS